MMTTTTSFYVVSAVEDTDDFGEPQVSYYRTSVDAPADTSPKEIARLAKSGSDWRVLSFGEGTEDEVGKIWVNDYEVFPA